MVKKYFLYPLRGVISILLIILSTVFIATSTYIVALFVYPIPFKKLRQNGIKFLYRFSVYWIDLLSIPIRLSTYGKLEIEGPDNLQKNISYLLISNHVSYIDILLLSFVIHRKTPSFKFFAKRELIWTLPFAGLSMWLLGYPLLRRSSKKELQSRKGRKLRDIETTHRVCQQFIIHPTTLVNYIEGTRFTQEKRIRKQSPYQNLLKPKAGGMATVLNEMQGHLGGIIDATLVYKPEKLSFWKFCCGDFDKIVCHYRVIPPTEVLQGNYMEDREYRKTFQAWLNSIWQQKDDQINTIKSRI